MNTGLRPLIRTIACAAPVSLAPPCMAQQYPSRPILLLMPLQAGSAATGTYVVHLPWRGATQAALDVISNQVQVHVSAVSRSGRKTAWRA